MIRVVPSRPVESDVVEQYRRGYPLPLSSCERLRCERCIIFPCFPLREFTEILGPLTAVHRRNRLLLSNLRACHGDILQGNANLCCHLYIYEHVMLRVILSSGTCSI